MYQVLIRTSLVSNIMTFVCYYEFMLMSFVKKVEFTDQPFLTLNARLSEFNKTTQTRTKNNVLILADSFLRTNLNLKDAISNSSTDLIFYDLKTEPSTDYIDDLKNEVIFKNQGVIPKLIIGIGGGAVMDSAKALSNILNNPGKSETYQGWDLLKNPGVFKIGIPTLFGTGSETSRTCVLLNKKKNLKLGMNSSYSIFDELIIAPNFLESVAEPTLVLTALDSFFHSIEILDGKNRNFMADSLAERSLEHLNKYFRAPNEGDFKDLALSSFYGGIALSVGLVGLVHPFSAALSVVFGYPHNLANCLAMKGLGDFYPNRSESFWKIIEGHNMSVNLKVKRELFPGDLDSLYKSTIIHSKPLENHLGPKWREILNEDMVKSIFQDILG